MKRVIPGGRCAAPTGLGLLGAILLSVGLGGCPGSPNPALYDAGGDGGSAACNTDQAKAIFTKHLCSSGPCHSAATKTSGFDMESPGLENRLVGVTNTGSSLSCAAAGPYLVPGSHPATGLLLTKLNGGPGLCGAQMPFNLPALSPTELSCIQSWADALVAAAGAGGNTDAGGD